MYKEQCIIGDNHVLYCDSSVCRIIKGVHGNRPDMSEKVGKKIINYLKMHTINTLFIAGIIIML